MTRDNLSDAINNIDDRFIEEAKEIKQKKKTSKVLKFSIIAACFCILAFTGIKIWNRGFINKKIPITGDKIIVGEINTTLDSTTTAVTTTKKETVDGNGLGNNELVGGEEIQNNLPEKDNTNITINGTGFTQKEIEDYINNKSNEILTIIQMEYGRDIETVSVSKKPYSHISFGKNSYLNRDAIMLPILVNGKIMAVAEIVKAPDGIVDSINVGGNKWSVYNDILFNNPEMEIAFAYFGDSAFEFLVRSDNSVTFPVSDIDNFVENNLNSVENLYSNVKTKYNVYSGNDLKNQDNLINISN